MILNMVGGGGGAGLNFSVKAFASELLLPATAAENTIAVITDTAITDWVFASTQPTTRSDGTALSGGEVWISTGKASTVSFNALKKNGLWTYPTSCMQYISGAWVGKTAKTYQSGAWKSWAVYFFNRGDQYAELTGGWESDVSGYSPGGWVKKESAVPAVGQNFTASYTDGAGYTNFSTKNEVDLAGIRTLTVNIDTYVKSSQTDAQLRLLATNARLSHAPDTVASVTLASAAATSAGLLTLNVESISSAYIGIQVKRPATPLVMSEMYGTV